MYQHRPTTSFGTTTLARMAFYRELAAEFDV
jgi:hypothetical protein